MTHFVYIIQEGDMDEIDVDCHIKAYIKLRKKLDIDVKENVKVAQTKQKKIYDAKHQQDSFKIGQSVLLKNMKKLSKKGDKMSPNWTGPYEVIESLGKNMYRLRKKNGNKDVLKSIYNSTRLKKFNERGTFFTE